MCLQSSSWILKVQTTFLFEAFLKERKHIDTQRQHYGKAIKCHMNAQLQEKTSFQRQQKKPQSNMKNIKATYKTTN